MSTSRHDNHTDGISADESAAGLKRKAEDISMKVFVCGICQVTFDGDADKFYEHVNSVHADSHFVSNRTCPWHTCTSKSIWKTKSQYRIHLRVHTGEKPHKCDKCGKTFRQSGALRTHILTHTGVKPHKCDNCVKAFTRSTDLKMHILTHTGEKPHKCETCGETFSQYGSLKKHIRTHTGEKPYECKTCGKTFRESSHLNKHILTHTGVKPHKCETCGEAFTQSGSLKTHIRTHTGEKPYECKTCGETFRGSSSLNKHILTHTGVKPHKCETCGKAFTQSGTLKKHIRYMHIGPFCTTCVDHGRTPPIAVRHPDDLQCGFCSISSRFGMKEMAVFSALARYDWRLTHLRDNAGQALGCGVRRRPDSYVSLHYLMDLDEDDEEETGSNATSEAAAAVSSRRRCILVILEIDENYHRYYDVKCELKRIEEIQERHGGPVYIVRYNPDQERGLEPERLQELAERMVEIMESDYIDALDAFGGVLIEYIGYPENQINKIELAQLRSQCIDDDEDEEEDDDEDYDEDDE